MHNTFMYISIFLLKAKQHERKIHGQHSLKIKAQMYNMPRLVILMKNKPQS